MPLTPPTSTEIALFRNEGDYAADEVPYVNAVAQQATDAVWVFTGLENPPTDPRAARVLKNALIQFTLWVMAQDEHRDEINSPFSSERIGSYSYSKMQQASRGEETGIFWLDLLFKMLNTGDGAETISWSSSENVFNPYELTYQQQEWLTGADPLVDWYGR